jgi:hypothetical protein
VGVVKMKSRSSVGESGDFMVGDRVLVEEVVRVQGGFWGEGDGEVREGDGKVTPCLLMAFMRGILLR